MSSQALVALRRTRARQGAALRWTRRIAPVLFVAVVALTLTNGRDPGLLVGDVVAVLVVGGFALGVLSVLTVRHRRAVIRMAWPRRWSPVRPLMVVQPAAGLAGLLVGLVLLPPRVPDRLPIALSIVVITGLAVVAVVVGRGAPIGALFSGIAIVGFPGMTLLARRLVQAGDQAELLLIELEGSRAAQAEAARLAERQRLAREMHDVLAHSLSGLILQLEGARMLAAGDPADPRLPAIIERAHHLGKAGLEEARRAIGLLRDDELPGPGRLADLAAQFQLVNGVPCQFTVSGQAHELPAEAAWRCTGSRRKRSRTSPGTPILTGLRCTLATSAVMLG